MNLNEFELTQFSEFSSPHHLTIPSLNLVAAIVSGTGSDGVMIADYFNTEQCCDIVTVYDGPGTTYPLLGSLIFFVIL